MTKIGIVEPEAKCLRSGINYIRTGANDLSTGAMSCRRRDIRRTRQWLFQLLQNQAGCSLFLVSPVTIPVSRLLAQVAESVSRLFLHLSHAFSAAMSFREYWKNVMWAKLEEKFKEDMDIDQPKD